MARAGFPVRPERYDLVSCVETSLFSCVALPCGPMLLAFARNHSYVAFERVVPVLPILLFRVSFEIYRVTA